MLNWLFGSLAALSLALLLWQWLAARRFPLHERVADKSFRPPVTLLKPLKGRDALTGDCLRSWFTQDYAGPVQILFGVASENDPAGDIVRSLLKEFPDADAQLVVCGPSIGPNAKVSKLAELEKLAKHDLLVISDADVRVPPDFLANVVAPFSRPADTLSPADSGGERRGEGAPQSHNRTSGLGHVGLVTCFYRLANPSTPAMQWEAIAVNADFWSQVLQARSLKPIDFALGAVMLTRRRHVAEIGGFQALADCLADDYQLGHRLARNGHRLELCPVVVECWDPPMTWRQVWKHQLRWARTIRVCQPWPYLLSLLSNVTLWALVWAVVQSSGASVRAIDLGSGVDGFAITTAWPGGILVALGFLVLRLLAAHDLQRRLTRSTAHANYFWLVPIKDLLQAALWLCAFAGNRIEWRGERFILRRDGTLRKV